MPPTHRAVSIHFLQDKRFSSDVRRDVFAVKPKKQKTPQKQKALLEIVFNERRADKEVRNGSI